MCNQYNYNALCNDSNRCRVPRNYAGIVVPLGFVFDICTIPTYATFAGDDGVRDAKVGNVRLGLPDIVLQHGRFCAVSGVSSQGERD